MQLKVEEESMNYKFKYQTYNRNQRKLKVCKIYIY